MPAKRALVVGINNYPPPNTLPSCVSDAKAFENMLAIDYGFGDVQSLLDSQATSDNFEASLKKMFAYARPGDTIVLFYSGHGYSMKDDTGVMEEYIVLRDRFYSGHELSVLTQDLPPGTLTVVLDSCFSGGMEKAFYALMRADGVVERAKAKVWTPISDEQIDKGALITSYRPFGCAPVDVTALPGPPDTKLFQVRDLVSRNQQQATTLARVADAATAAPPAAQAFAKGLQLAMAKADTPGRLQMNGLLIAACSEDETAAASTSATNGLSAFTCCFLQEIASQAAQGRPSSVASLVSAAHDRLRGLGFVQSPVVKSNPTGLENYPLLAMPAPTTTVPAPPAGPAVVPTSIDDLINTLRLLASGGARPVASSAATNGGGSKGIGAASLSGPALVQLFKSLAMASTSAGA